MSSASAHFPAGMDWPRLSARVIDLVTPGASGTGHGKAGRIWQADPRFAGDGYVLLDSHRVGPEDLRRDNAAALLSMSFPPKQESTSATIPGD